jgi:hypothetical protein
MRRSNFPQTIFEIFHAVEGIFASFTVKIDSIPPFLQIFFPRFVFFSPFDFTFFHFFQFPMGHAIQSKEFFMGGRM